MVSPAPTPANEILPQTILLPPPSQSNPQPKPKQDQAPAVAPKPVSALGPTSQVKSEEFSSSKGYHIGKLVNLNVWCKGKKYPIKARYSGYEDEALALATDGNFLALGKAFSCRMAWSDKGFTVTQGKISHTLKVGEYKLPAAVGGRDLAVPCQLIENKPYVPMSCLEDFLQARLTFEDTQSAWLDSTITSVRVEGNGSKQQLIIDAGTPLDYKCFTLQDPARYVIDVKDGVLDTESECVAHPQLGIIRLGQFQYYPAVSRIVVPMATGVSIVPPQGKSSRQLVFSIVGADKAVPSDSRYCEQRLISSQVEEGKGKSTIKLAFSGPVRYDWSRLVPPDYRFVVDLPNVVLTHKERLKLHHSAVKEVRLSQNSGRPSAVARLVLDLKRPAGVELTPGADGKSLAITVGDSDIAPNKSLVKGTGATGSGTPSSSSHSDSSTVHFYPDNVNSKSGVKVICIDPGHGGNDSGAVHRTSGLCEDDVTLDVCLRLADLLRRDGWRVVMTRDSDRDVSYAGSTDTEELWARCKVSNDAKADVFLSVHCNAAASQSAQGTSIHYYKKSDLALGEELIGPLVKAMGRNNRGVQHDRFFVLAYTEMPAVLVETAFISNHEEASLLGDGDYRQRVAEGLREGLNSYAAKYLKGRTLADTAVHKAETEASTTSVVAPPTEDRQKARIKILRQMRVSGKR